MVLRWDADVCFVDNHVTVTAITSSFFDSTMSQKDAILLDIDLTFIVAIRTLLRLGDGPGFRLISPESKSMSDTTTFGFDREIADNFRSVHTVRHGNSLRVGIDTSI